MAIRFHNDTRGAYTVCDTCLSQSDVHETFIAEPNEEVDMTALPVDMCVDCRQMFRRDGFTVTITED